ncbi:MAG TPA: hypothetical protein VE074_04735 [Jatrophihabitantaceae bacterium]|nr:hypothetical protein [Jatrophihabitantaceae bacterium]
MKDDIDIESVLRASLAEHARQTPDADRLAERIIADADHPRPVHDPHRPRRWSGWMLPAIAAGSVAAVVGAVIAVAQLGHSGRHAADQGPLTSDKRSAASSPVSTESGQVYASTLPTPASTAPGLPGGVPVPAFRVIDLTFTSTQVGWALGNGTCLDGSPGICPAVMRTDDGGSRWISTPNPPASLPVDGSCAAPCVDHVRFANDNVGYAFGPGALFMTVDGGQSWGNNEDPAGTSSLEVANGTALRVTGERLVIADVGQTSWKPAALPAKATVKGDVVRSRDRAYVSAGSSNSLYVSTNDGAKWAEQPSPCSGSAIGSLSTGADGSVVVLCAPVGPATPAVYTSNNDATSFTPIAGLTTGNFDGPFGAADGSTLFRSSSGQLERTTDEGKHWARVATDKTKGVVAFLGFESPTVGRWVTGDGSTIYTTTDAGQHWTPYKFK